MKILASTRTRAQSVSNNLEKSLSRYALATATIAAVAIPAAAKADFSGYYAPANWTFQNTGGSTDGSVDTSGAPASITLTGGNSQSGTPGDTNFTIAAGASGLVSFHWTYSSMDSGTYDSGNFLLNGNPTFLADNGSQGSGDFSIAVSGGNIFGFNVHSMDNLFGPGVLTISNFSAPVPEGSTLSLFALGALGVMMVMRRRARAAA
ncbi:MAG: PEP-CTERM sorting domain-containing protein [Verrucomicrobia bacterium]|nr:MAG: PEP-CTERM sorting domain-containing protein [Verrucomicrobiota bacterium]